MMIKGGRPLGKERSGTLRLKVESKNDNSDNRKNNNSNDDDEDSDGDDEDSDDDDEDSDDDNDNSKEHSNGDSNNNSNNATCELEGAIELHRLTVEDFAQLERRAEEITEEIIDATCTVDDGDAKEVRHAPLPLLSPGHAPVSCLQIQSLGLGAPAAKQGRGSKQNCKIKEWRCANPSLLCCSVRLFCCMQEPTCKWSKAGHRQWWEKILFDQIIVV